MQMGVWALQAIELVHNGFLLGFQGAVLLKHFGFFTSEEQINSLE